MNDNPVKFFVRIGHELCRIFLYPIDADENVAFDIILLFAMIEGDNVGQGLVIQVLLVDGKEIGIGTKNVAEVSELMVFFLNDCLDPIPGLLRF